MQRRTVVSPSYWVITGCHRSTLTPLPFSSISPSLSCAQNRICFNQPKAITTVHCYDLVLFFFSCADQGSFTNFGVKDKTFLEEMPTNCCGKRVKCVELQAAEFSHTAVNPFCHLATRLTRIDTVLCKMHCVFSLYIHVQWTLYIVHHYESQCAQKFETLTDIAFVFCICICICIALNQQCNVSRWEKF